MAGLVRVIGKTRLGFWLWTRGRNAPLAGALIGGAANIVRATERAVLRRLPAHRRHDAAARAALARFEADTRAMQAADRSRMGHDTADPRG
jgi:hypothetical protein